MKNREKYPNTEDALKAFEKHNKVCGCGCSFEEWLDKEAPSVLNMAVAGVLLGSLSGKIVGTKDKPADRESEKPSNDDVLTNVECPICHSKNGKIDGGMFLPSFTCPDCKAFVGVSRKGFGLLPPSFEEFKSFMADLCTKNNAKA